MNEKRRKRLMGFFGPIRRERKKGEKRAARNNIKGRIIKRKSEGGSIHALIYQRDNLGPDEKVPVLFEVHGGGFMYNSAYDDDELCAYIHRKLGITVVAVNYRRTPGYPFPAGLKDVYNTIRYISTKQEFHTDPANIYILGHSAGANLAAGAVLMANQKKEFVPALQILDYPYLNVWLDSRKRPQIPRSLPARLMNMFADFYMKEGEARKNPYVSPVFAADEMVKGIAPTYILTCGCDNLNIDGEQYAALLRKNKVAVTEKSCKGAIHGFIENTFNYQYIPWNVKWTITKKQKKMAYEAVDEWCRWIQERQKSMVDPKCLG